MSPNSVEELLERHGERWRTAFVPPSLDGMLAVATASPRHRTRWAWPLAAAVALLLIPLATVMSVHRSHRAPAANQLTKPPSDLLGDVPWSLPILQTDGKAVTIAVNVNRVECATAGSPILRGVESETATTVTITVKAYRSGPLPSVPPGTVLGCNMPSHLPVPLTVTLKQPLGDRALIDAATGIRQPLTLAASTVPAPSYLPAGYVDRGFRWQDVFFPHPTQALHEYTGPGPELDLVRGHGHPMYSTGDRTLGTGYVLGHPAKLLRSDAFGADGTCLDWSDSEYWWSLCSRSDTSPLSASELLRIGNSIR